MKFKIKEHEFLSERIKRTFALFPIKIENEIRWLEFVNIKQRYGHFPTQLIEDRWENIEFIDD